MDEEKNIEGLSLEETTISDDTRESLEMELDGLYIELRLGLEFREKIGEGGFGDIWKGYLVGREYNKEVAIKVSKRSRKSLNSLIEEAYISGQLKHDDIGKIILYEEHNGKGMIIMEYIDGKDLSKIAKWHEKLGLHFPQKFAAFVGWICCEVLKYAHSARVYDNNGKEVIGVLHRDISLGNIIIDNFGYTKLVDFGLGITSSDLDNDKIGKIAGKIGFMAPEIFSGKIDRRIDIYSLGAVMDYLIRGRNPIIDQIKKRSMKLGDILKHKVRTLREEVLGVDEQLLKIIEKATKANKEERYDNAFEMKEDLKKYLYDVGYGPDRDRLKLYIDLVYTPGFSRYLNTIKNGEDIKTSPELKNKIEDAKLLMPYMIRNGKFCLETLPNSGYKTEESGYLPIY